MSRVKAIPLIGLGLAIIVVAMVNGNPAVKKTELVMMGNSKWFSFINKNSKTKYGFYYFFNDSGVLDTLRAKNINADSAKRIF